MSPTLPEGLTIQDGQIVLANQKRSSCLAWYNSLSKVVEQEQRVWEAITRNFKERFGNEVSAALLLEAATGSLYLDTYQELKKRAKLLQAHQLLAEVQTRSIPPLPTPKTVIIETYKLQNIHKKLCGILPANLYQMHEQELVENICSRIDRNVDLPQKDLVRIVVEEIARRKLSLEPLPQTAFVVRGGTLQSTTIPLTNLFLIHNLPHPTAKTVKRVYLIHKK